MSSKRKRTRQKPKSSRPIVIDAARHETPKPDAAAPTWWGQPLELTISAKLKLRFQQLPAMDDMTDAQKLEQLVTLWECFYARGEAEGAFGGDHDPDPIHCKRCDSDELPNTLGMCPPCLEEVAHATSEAV
jgi:hypothetical protein